MPAILEDAENAQSVSFRQLLARLRELYRQVEEIEAEIKRWHQDNEATCQFRRHPGNWRINGQRIGGERRRP